MFIYFILPFPLNNIVCETVQELSEKVIVKIPLSSLIKSGQLNIEIAFQHKTEDKYITIPKRMKIDIVETVSENESADISLGDCALTTINELIKKMENISKEILPGFESEINLIIESNKNQLLEYKNILEHEMKEDKLNEQATLIQQLYEFIDSEKNKLITFFDENKIILEETNIKLIEDLKSEYDNSISNLQNEYRIFSDFMEESYKKIIDNFNEIKEENIENINSIVEDGIKRIGTQDDSMYNHFTPSIRKEAIESIKKEKIEIVSSAKKEISEQMKEEIANLKEQRFIGELKPFQTQITLPGSFIVSDMTKVFCNGLLLTYNKDYRVEHGSNIIWLLKTFDIKQDLVVTETLAQKTAKIIDYPVSDNVPNTIVVRDSEGNFKANKVFANSFVGEATVASKLAKPFKINGIDVDGSKDITIPVDNLEEATEDDILELFK